MHCHAGYGRTGLAIACAFIFIHNLPPDRAIKIVRRDRPGSIQTTDQTKFVYSFYEYINGSSVIFALPFIHDRFTIARTVEQQNLLLHGEKFASPLPKIIDVICSALEKGIMDEDAARSVAHSFIAHLPISHFGTTRPDSRNVPIAQDHDTAVEEHVRSISAVQSARDAFESSPPAPSILFPAGCKPLVRESHLFPVKVAFNVGEWNWPEAIELCTSIMYYPPLLLDWLEHLAEPLLSPDLLEKLLGSPQRVVTPPQAYSDSSADAAAAQKFRALHQLPACVVRSLDRIVNCLRMLQAKLALAEAGVKSDASTLTLRTPVFDAVCVRISMAIFQVRPQTSSATTSTLNTSSVLRHCTDFLEVLIAEWLAPKRLELNLESLERIRRASSLRKLQLAGTFTPGPQADTPALSAPSTPKAKHAAHAEQPLKSTVSPMPVLEPVQLSRAPRSESPSPQKSSSKMAASPVKTDQHSPRRLTTGLPPASTSSPVKTDTIASPRGLQLFDTPVDLPCRSATPSSNMFVAPSAPTTPQADKLSEHSNNAKNTIMEEASGSGATQSCTLPSVRGVERYRKHSNTTGALL